MERVLGIGGVFIGASDPALLAAWYRDNLGVEVDDTWGGASFPLSHPSDVGGAHVVWSAYADTTTSFGSPTPRFVINYRVSDLEAMLTQLRTNGCAVDDREDHSAYGDFGWVTDPEGNRIELWQPPEQYPTE
jgi:predicted enzyme related to lactoylglutathione lyase